MKHSWWISTLALVATAPVLAHTPLTKSEPANGATLTPPVRRITLEFAGDVELTAVTLTDSKGVEEHLEAPPSGTATKFAVGVGDALDPGDYVIAWRAVGADAHVMSGQIHFKVTGPAAH